MAAPRITATNHTAFTVSDLAKAAAFFRDILGFPVTQVTRHQGNVAEKITGLAGAVLDILYVEAPGHRIELIQFLAPPGRSELVLRPCDVGFAHIAFETDDLEGVLANAMEAGYTAVGPPQRVTAGPRQGGKTVYFRGPDGIIFELQEAPKRAEGRE